MAPLLIVFLTLSMFAQSLTVMATTKDQLVETAKTYIGTPYHYGGTTPNGFDCSGYINYVFEQLDVNLPRTTSGLYQEGTSVSKSDLEVGDIVFFNTFGSGVSHAGIYIGDGEFIHASTSRGVTTDSLNSDYWSPRYLGAKRVTETEPEIEQASLETSRELEPGEYRDVKENHWAYDEVLNLSQDDVIHGTGDDEFGVNGDLTRAEVASLLVRANDLSAEGKNSSFIDVEGHWSAKEVAAAEQAGFLDHLTGERFKPEEKVTREEVAVMVANAFDLEANGQNGFTDVTQVHDAYDEITALKEHGIINGYDDGTFRPNHTITRAEFAIVLYKLMN
ncbi:C40 family peptidase [Tenuibacillus multivorans]|nr:C40 family peptidase [Tenuibacillus multivorans]